MRTTDPVTLKQEIDEHLRAGWSLFRKANHLESEDYRHDPKPYVAIFVKPFELN